MIQGTPDIYRTITVLDSVKQFPVNELTDFTGKKTTGVFMQVESSSIRYSLDGGTLSRNDSFVMCEGSIIEIPESEIDGFRFINAIINKAAKVKYHLYFKD